MTKSQVNKLGQALRAPGLPTQEQLTALQEFRRGYEAPMVEARARLAEDLGVESTSRLKTVNTIVDKLRREKTRLSEMQDIAGLRVVKDMLLSEQDALVAGIASLFPVTKIVDRRKKPSHGYRAVHVIATVLDHSVEIQVRTHVQDAWAQAVERLADRRGRDLRYGRSPVPESDAGVLMLLESSRSFETIESWNEFLAQRRLELAHAAGGGALATMRQLWRRRKLESLARKVDRLSVDMRRNLQSLVEHLE